MLRIIIDGDFGEGKTTLQALVSEFLRSRGYSVENHEVQEVDSVIENKLSVWAEGAAKDGCDGRHVRIDCISKEPHLREASDLVLLQLRSE